MLGSSSTTSTRVPFSVMSPMIGSRAVRFLNGSWEMSESRGSGRDHRVAPEGESRARRRLSHGVRPGPSSGCAWVTTSGGRGQIPSLDGLRAVAVGFVILSHLQLVFTPGLVTGTALVLATAGGQPFVFLQGGFGVTIFFFLSGYLITTLLRVEHERTGTISLPVFSLPRVLRTPPPLYIVLLGGVAVTALGLVRGWRLTAPGLLSQALFAHNYYQ